MNIRKFADKAGVSIATISRALNSETRHKVAPETLEKINHLSEQFGYAPNLAAKYLTKASFQIIGVLLPHFRGIFFSDYYAKVLSGIADALFETEYGFKLIMLKDEKKVWDKHDFKSSESVDGILVTHWPNFFSDVSVLEKLKTPCVVVNDVLTSSKVCSIGSDNWTGGHLAAEYLYQKGHRHFLVLSGPAWSGDSQSRVGGFKQFLKKQNKKISVETISADFQEEKARVISEEVLKTNRCKVTAVFCCNDLMALGVLKCLESLKIACPSKISVFGYDNDLRSQFSNPPLSTIESPVYEVAKYGAQKLLYFLETKNKKKFFTKTPLIPVRLIERSSVGNLIPA